MEDNQNNGNGARWLVAISVCAGLASIATLLFGDNLLGRMQERASTPAPVYSNLAGRESTGRADGLTFSGVNTSASNSADALEMPGEMAYNTAWDSSPNENATTGALGRPQTVHPAFRK